MGCYFRKLKKGGRWFFSGQYLNIKYFSKAIYLTKGECAKAERERLKQLDEQARNPGLITLKDLFIHRLDYLQLTRNREYYEDNQRLCKQALDAFGDIQISEVTPKMAADLILDEIRRCKKLKLGNSRPNQLLKVMKASYNYAIKRLGYDMRNPFANLQKLPEDTKMKFLPTEEMIEAVKAACNRDQRRLIDFVLSTGARINEAIALDYEDVFDDFVALYTRKSRNSERTPRYVPKPPFISIYGRGKVFKPWTSYPRFLEDKIKGLGQPKWNWHSLRHLRASIWAREKPLFEIMMLLGHTQISTTQRYLHSLGIIKL
jgi:integrase